MSSTADARAVHVGYTVISRQLKGDEPSLAYALDLFDAITECKVCRDAALARGMGIEAASYERVRNKHIDKLGVLLEGAKK
jgi:hypothetical protein